MSRSRKKTPIFGHTTAISDKPHKQSEHRRERRRVKIEVAQGEEPTEVKRFGDPWDSDKDGKSYWAKAAPKDMRK